MNDQRYFIEIAKIVIAYFASFFVLIAPLAATWIVAIKLASGSNQSALIFSMAAAATAPAIILGLVLSGKVAGLFFENWGPK